MTLKNAAANGQPSHRQSGRVRLEDVAKAADVSNSSVSNYMNGRFERLGAETRDRIAAAIERLGFRPNQAARQLKTGKAKALAMVVPSVVNPFNGELVFAVEQAAAKHGLSVHLCNTMRDADLEMQFLDNLVGIGVTDVILHAPLTTARASKSQWKSFSVVALDASRKDLGFDHLSTVNIDHEEAVELAVQHLCELGHRSIAYVTDSLVTYSRVARLLGFRRSVGERGLREAVIILSRDDRVLDTNDAQLASLGDITLSEMLALDPQPTAVVAFNDMIAFGLMASLRTAGLTVPTDLSVVGIDDVWLSTLANPPLTTVRQPLGEMAAAAVERVASRSETGVSTNSDAVFHTALVVRESTSVPRTGRLVGRRRAHQTDLA